MKITAIIPLRITDHVFEARLRLSRIIAQIPSDKFNVLIVDYGTPESHQQQLAGLHTDHVSVLRHECDGGTFSIGHARDLGVQHAPDSVVMFHDIDFFASTSMYQRIHAEVMAREMDQRAYDFFCVPVFFLTEAGSSTALDLVAHASAPDQRLHRHLFEASPGMIEFPAYGSSAIVVNKHHYLGIGGHSREFYGHGAEDYDVLHRLAAHCPKGPRTADYYVDTKSNDIVNYRGFRAYFALYGLDVFARGIYMVHLWHPKRTIPGYHQSKRNFSLLTDLMQRFDKHREQPLPLADCRIDRRTLILMTPNSSAFKSIRHVAPQLGSFEILPESDFSSPEELLSFLKRHRFDDILFLNPYGNDHRLALYRGVREAGFPFLVFDRGALPDSWFFDDGGFNFDSDTYAPNRWDHPVDATTAAQTAQYLQNLRHSEDALEANGARKSARYWREKYGIGHKKVLFVPFQRPSDTVTNHFAGEPGSVAGFQEWVRAVVAGLPRSEWAVICKNHPLDQDLPQVEGAIYAGQDAHIHDLLELADKVLLMNSGVGVLAMAFETPVICTAQAFYGHQGLCHQASSAEHALTLVQANLTVDKEKVERFYSHLLQAVYSFGKTHYRKALAADGSQRSIAETIIFESIRIPGRPSLHLGAPPQGVSLDAPLFTSFGGRAGVKAGARGLSEPAKPLPRAAQGTAQSKPAATTTTSRPKAAAEVSASVSAGPTPRPFQKKLRKLVRHPRLFVADFLIKRGIASH